jgi:glutamate 5-kinase
VATAEIHYGDNDRLAQWRRWRRQLPVLLSDVDGLYSADPNKDPAAEYFPEVRAITSRIEAMAGGSASDVGSGGMATKIAAARIAMDAGCHMCIATGHPLNPLKRVEAGARCTWFVPGETPLPPASSGYREA